MRVLLAAGGLAPRDGGSPGAESTVLPARAALAALREGWHAGAPTADVVGVVCSDGAADLLDAVESVRGGRREVLAVTASDGERSVPLIVLRAGETVYVPAVDVLGTLGEETVSGGTAPTGGAVADAPDRRGAARAAAAVRGATSHGVGEAVRHAVASGARRVVLGAAAAPALDLGLGALRALAGLEPVRGQSPGPRTTELGDLLCAARARLGTTELVLAASSPLTVRGLRGAGARLSQVLGRAEASALEKESAPVADALARARPAPRSLLGTDLHEHGRAEVPGAGVGGGLGAAVLALGGRVVPGPRFIAAETDVAARAHECDLVVVLTDRLDPLEADSGVLGAVAEIAAREGTAVLALGRTGVLPRRAAAPYGISATSLLRAPAGPGADEVRYGVEADPYEVGGGVGDLREALRRTGRTAAREWSW